MDDEGGSASAQFGTDLVLLIEGSEFLFKVAFVFGACNVICNRGDIGCTKDAHNFTLKANSEPSIKRTGFVVGSMADR